MVDLRADSIIYQAQGYLTTLVDSLITNKRLGKHLDKSWEKADQIIAYLETWAEKDKLADVDQINYILECLILLCNLNQFPAAPTFNVASPPAVLIGLPGSTGGKGDTGATGPAGLATDIQISVAATTVVDSFNITAGKAARWDYFVQESSGAQRASSIIGHWKSGETPALDDAGAPDIGGATTGIEFDLQITGSTVELVAIITSGTWSVTMTRYFIPNNGSGTGPISDALQNGYIFIGNASNLAAGHPVTGVISLSNTGVASFPAGIIQDADINSAAAIALSKLAALPASKLVATTAGGVLTTINSPTLAEIAHVGGATGNLQIQINTRMADPMTSIGDMIIRNGGNTTTRLGIGTTGQVLTVAGGLPTWASPTGGYVYTLLNIGDWNMDSTLSVTVNLPIPRSKIRSIDITIRSNDTGGGEYTLYPFLHATGLQGGVYEVSNAFFAPADTITLTRTIGGVFDSTLFNSTGWNRGWIFITSLP